MDNQQKEILGAGIVVVGTIATAIGSTPFQSLSRNLRRNLNLWGNVLQAVGNGLEAEGQEGFSLEKLGNEIQSAGNVTVVGGLLLSVEEETRLRLFITGNLLQALGGATALGDEFNDPTAAGQSLNITGNFLQAIGNSLQALGDSQKLRQLEEEKGQTSAEEAALDDEREQVSAEEAEAAEHLTEKSEIEEELSEPGLAFNVTGSWIQAVGSVISFFGQLQEETQEDAQEEGNEDGADGENTFADTESKEPASDGPETGKGRRTGMRSNLL